MQLMMMMMMMIMMMMMMMNRQCARRATRMCHDLAVKSKENAAIIVITYKKKCWRCDALQNEHLFDHLL
jgi:hypothetical protein